MCSSDLLYKNRQAGLTKGEILQGYLKIYDRPLAEWQLRREYLPMLEQAGLIVQEQDPDDKRTKLITPITLEVETKGVGYKEEMRL